MKSGTSYFNNTVFRKNMTRFAPAWGLYTLAMFMGLFMMSDSGSNWLPGNMADCVQIMSVITPCFAFLTAQLLFGDLFNTRMCNALHAMPIRREGWFVTNLVSGFVFHLIPTVAMGAVATLIMAAVSYPMGWVMGPLWILCVNLQYICFFGIAVFSVMCVGSRFAMAVVYGIVNVGSLIAGWMVSTLYEPMLYGIQLDLEPFFWFSPIGFLVEHTALRMDVVYEYIGNSGAVRNVVGGELMFEEGWGYLWIAAAAGIVLTLLALVLYRRRKLECAGDFMAVKNMEPVFLIAYTLCMGAAFQFVMDDMFGMGGAGFFLFVGLAVGYFTGQMLLQRTIRVFSLKAFLRCVAVMAVMGATLVIVALDPLGIETWIPDAAEVKSVTVADGHYNYHDCEITLTEKEDIEKVLAIHREALENQNEGTVEISTTAVPEIADIDLKYQLQPEDYYTTIPITIEYHLNDGRVVSRYYYIWNYTESGSQIKAWFNSPLCVFGMEGGLEELYRVYHTVEVNCYYSDFDTILGFKGEDVKELLAAILADCEAGTMSQEWDFHQWDNSAGWLHFNDVLELRVYTSNENILAWMGEHGIDVEALLEER